MGLHPVHAGRQHHGPTSRPGIQGGFQIGVGHFAVGFSGAYYQNYLHDDYSAANTASSKDDGWVVAVGGSYAVDAWSFGLQGIYGELSDKAPP